MAAPDITLEKVLPHSPEAERAVLGAVLLDNQLFDQAASILHIEDFHVRAHQTVFASMASLSTALRAIDAVTLRAELEKGSHLQEIGGASYISSLLDGVPRLTNIEHYARIVKEKSVQRKLIHAAYKILEQSYTDDLDAADLVEEAERSIFKISQERVEGGFVKLGHILPDAYKQIQSFYEQKSLITGIGTGYTDLDALTSGFQKTDLIIIAARPGLGKTSLALNIGQYAALAHNSVGIFSLEMSSFQLVTRLLCSHARIDSHKLRSGRLSKGDWTELAATMGHLDQAKIFIDDAAGISIMEMRSRARRLKAEHGLDLLIVDYLQLMSPSGGGRKSDNREREISTISRSLKALAKELNIPVVTLSQLSRAPEQRRGRQLGRPQLSDLRESGAIEQDADVVIFIYREDLYKKPEDLEDEPGVAEIIIAKQRNGPTGVVKLAFIDKWTRFENLAFDRE